MFARCKKWILSAFTTNESEEQSSEPKQTNHEKGNNSANNSQLFITITSTLIDGVKVAMATLLSIFVPQYCAETGGTCTLQENFTNLTTFNEFVIGWNFITLGLFSYLAYVQNTREAYFISHLEEDLNQPYTSLHKIAKDYPKILNRVKAFNKKLYTWSKWTVIFFGCNVMFSSILVFYYFYDGFRTATTLLANVLLVSTKLYATIEICKKCNSSKPMALSTIHSTSISYNVIDDNYVKQPKKTGMYELSVKIDPSKAKRRRASSVGA
jgi:hypothetical protein